MVMQTVECEELSMEKGRWRSEQCPLTSKNTLIEMRFSRKSFFSFHFFSIFMF